MLEQAIEDWEQNLMLRVGTSQIEPITRSNKEARIKTLMEWIQQSNVNFLKLTPRDVEDFGYWMTQRKNLALSSANQVFSASRDFYDFLIRRRQIGDHKIKIRTNPFEKIRFRLNLKTKHQQADDRALSFPQVVECIKTTQDLDIKAAIATMAGTGLRLSELTRLTRNDVYFDKHHKTIRLIIKPSKNGKGRETFFIDQKFEKIFIQWWKCHRKQRFLQHKSTWDADQLFAFQPNSLMKYCRRLSQKLGYRVTCHAFRFSFAVRYIETGGDPEMLKALLGHSTNTMTDWYQRICKLTLPHRAFKPRFYDPRHY